ncbi:MAG: Na(+)/H(+) antiporter subunit D, partial [bacterium]|nr:Na(+)/H(+) antiporter subunit D [bacterium]
TEKSTNAAFRYLMMQLISGLLILMGIGLHLGDGGTVEFTKMTTLLEGGAWGPILIFLGLGVKCGWPIFHIWITDGYPASTVTGAIFLSAFTTKLAVYALARGFPGAEALIWIGTAMAVFPIFYAVIENDLRRVLCYSMINQIGYMVVGIGIGTNLSINGTAAHAFADIIFKGLLFMAMGAVLYRTGRINGSDLGGLHRSMPWTTTFCCIGAASISAFPLFSGFITKSMIMTAAAQEGMTFVWFALLFGAAGVFHHAGIKIPYFAFFSHDSGMRPKEAPKNMLFAMGISAGLCIFIGCVPSFLYGMLPNYVDPSNPAVYHPYSTAHVITQTQLLFWSALAFTSLMLLRIYPPELRSVNLDADWAWRRGTRSFVRFVTGPLMALFTWMSHLVHERIPAGLVVFSRNPPGAM